MEPGPWRLRTILAAAAAAAGLLVPAVAVAAARATPIPGPRTVLPTFVGHAARAHPIPPPASPQNPMTAPNPFGWIHSDPWQSDTATVAGPLGRAPTSWSSRLVEARPHRLFRLGHLFECGTPLFDSHGRLESTCLDKAAAALVLVDPVSLKVLAHLDLPGTRSVLTGSTASAYFYLDDQDRAVIATTGKHIWVVAQAGTVAQPGFTKSADYDLSNVGSGPSDKITAIAPDWRGRIWFVTQDAVTGVFDPAKYPAPDAVHQLALGSGEKVSNGQAMTASAGYLVSSEKMYRIAAGADGKPRVVWSAPYETTGKRKPGQYSLGSGTTPTILDHGRYVAITDNAEQLHVVVYRTAAALGPDQQRKVCQVPVFPRGRGATEASLIGSGRSLIAVNYYGYRLFWFRFRSTRSEPGVARVDINADGDGCRLVWSNPKVENIAAPTLSSKTGLVYLYSRRVDPRNHAYVWYWTAVDFRTGKVVWKRLAGTGRRYESWFPRLVFRAGIAYWGAFDGLVAMRDTVRRRARGYDHLTARERKLVQRRCYHRGNLIQRRGSLLQNVRWARHYKRAIRARRRTIIRLHDRQHKPWSFRHRGTRQGYLAGFQSGRRC